MEENENLTYLESLNLLRNKETKDSKKSKKKRYKRAINRKAKGIAAERDLVHKFHSLGWSAIRVAGSGSTKYPAPDVLAGNGHRRIAIEAKTIAGNRKYFSNDDLEQLRVFATNFGCEMWIAVKFPDLAWVFFHPEDLKATKNAHVATIEMGSMIGFSLKEVLGEI